MSSSEPPVSPFANNPPKISPQPAPPQPAGLDYLRMYSYIFDGPQWGMTILFAVICQFIPVIGNIVLMGYQYEIVEQLHRGKPRYPAFNFDDIVAYLSRGVWPFLVALVVALVLVPVVLLGVGGAAVLIGLLELNEEGALVVILPMIGAGVLLSVALTFLLVPVTLRAGLSQNFATAFDLRFARDFVAKTWLEILLGTLFLMVTYFGLAFVGMLLCFVGIYPAIVLLMLAQAHLNYQLYAIYLRRGGELIPLRELR